MEQALNEFSRQFAFEPEIINGDNLFKADKSIVVGMGGSNLAAELLKIWDPKMDVIVHRNYGLPDFSEEVLKSRLIILSSYSGNTEEVLSALDECLDKKLNCAVITTGGNLLELAKKNRITYIQMPDTGIQPRHALGYAIIALAKITGLEGALSELKELSTSLDSDNIRKRGEILADKLKDRIPLIYSSIKNTGIAYNFKIKFNETAKIPAFYNVFPELNHNEMTGFDLGAKSGITEKFYFVFIKDEDDNGRIIKRMEITEKMLKGKGFEVVAFEVRGEKVFEKIFSSLLAADWAGFSLANYYGRDPEANPTVEEFKKLII